MDILKKSIQLLSKYRYAVLIVLVGVVLMLIPTGNTESQESPQVSTKEVSEDLAQELATILGQIRGVGKVKVMLTVEEGEKLLYQQDTPLAVLRQTVSDFAAQGLSVSVQKVKPETLRYKKLAKFNGSEVMIIENDA